MRGPLHTAAVLSALLLGTGIYAKHNNTPHAYESIEEGIKHHTIRVKIYANGKGYSGNCISLEIVHLKKDTAYYYLEAGRRLAAADPTAQDILVTQSQQFAFRGKEKKHVKVFGFCCQAHHHAPRPNASYAAGKTASYNLVLIAKYFDRHRNYATIVQQHAIWTISDNNALCSIPTDSKDSLKSLLDTLAHIKGVELPWYSLTYVPDKTVAFSGNASVFTCSLQYNLTRNSPVTINVYDDRGILMLTYCQPSGISGTNIIPVSIDVKGWNKGIYSLCVMCDKNTLISRKFEI